MALFVYYTNSYQISVLEGTKSKLEIPKSPNFGMAVLQWKYEYI